MWTYMYLKKKIWTHKIHTIKNYVGCTYGLFIPGDNCFEDFYIKIKLMKFKYKNFDKTLCNKF